MKTQAEETERLKKIVSKIREAWTPEKNNDMNTTRDLKIAEAIGLECKLSEDGQRALYKDILGRWRRWNPSGNAEQREMIEDWVIKKGYTVKFNRSDFLVNYVIEGNLLEETWEGLKKSKSEAFLQAVEQLINLKEKK